MNKSYFYHRVPGILVAVSAALLVGGTAAFAITQAGTAADPLITQSYAETTYRNTVTTEAAARAGMALDVAQSKVDAALADTGRAYTDAALEAVLVRQVAVEMGAVLEESVSLAAGASLSAPLGTAFCVTGGMVSHVSGNLLNLTTGKQLPAGGTLTKSHAYLAAERGVTLGATAAARVSVRGGYTVSTPSQAVRYTAYADALYELGLFSGTNIGYELDRASNRAEGLVMLLRLLGKEQEARVYTGTHPFRDVPAWADRYVAYAYNQGYTSGISAAAYGTQQTLTIQDYMTFLLRALGYNDSKGDFSWHTAADTAAEYGILSQEQQMQDTFLRDDIVYTSYQALLQPMKGGTEHLSDRLIAQGVFTRRAFSEAAQKIS